MLAAAADPSQPSGDLDAGPRAAKPGTERMCAVTRQVRPVGELIRFVVSPAGEVVADLKRKLPGRGLWVSAAHRTVAEAARRHHFSRGFKRDLRASPTLADDIDRLLVRSLQDALAIAGKAGQAVCGFTKVETALSRRQAIALLHASDAAVDGVRKLDAVARQAQADMPVISVLSSAELDLALGRSNVIHAALLAGPASGTFVSRSQFLVRYRMAGSGGLDSEATKDETTPRRAIAHDASGSGLRD